MSISRDFAIRAWERTRPGESVFEGHAIRRERSVLVHTIEHEIAPTAPPILWFIAWPRPEHMAKVRQAYRSTAHEWEDDVKTMFPGSLAGARVQFDHSRKAFALKETQVNYRTQPSKTAVAQGAEKIPDALPEELYPAYQNVRLVLLKAVLTGVARHADELLILKDDLYEHQRGGQSAYAQNLQGACNTLGAKFTEEEDAFRINLAALRKQAH